MIRRFQKQDTIAVADLAKKTFAACNADDYFDIAGVEKTLDSFDTAKHSEQELYSSLSSADIFYVYEENGKIAGMVRGRKNRVHTLFVGAGRQNKGIGRRLMEKFEQRAKEQGTEFIEIHASLAAAAFYEKMGYKKLGGVCNFEDLKIYNMRKDF